MSGSSRRVVDRALELVADGVEPDEALALAEDHVDCAPAARSLARAVLLAIVTRPTTQPENSIQ